MRPQCYACNFLMNGRPHIYRENLVNEIGEERVKTLEARSKTLFKEKDDFIIERTTYFTEKLNTIEEAQKVIHTPTTTND